MSTGKAFLMVRQFDKWNPFNLYFMYSSSLGCYHFFESPLIYIKYWMTRAPTKLLREEIIQ